jgi:hypothetical protein
MKGTTEYKYNAPRFIEKERIWQISIHRGGNSQPGPLLDLALDFSSPSPLCCGSSRSISDPSIVFGCG